MSDKCIHDFVRGPGGCIECHYCGRPPSELASRGQQIKALRAERDALGSEIRAYQQSHKNLSADCDALATSLARVEAERDALAAHVEHIAPCVFHDADHDACLQHSGQMPCMTQTESDWLDEIRTERDALLAAIKAEEES